MQDMSIVDDERITLSPEEALLQAAVIKYREAWNSETLTPQIVNGVWQAFWNERMNALGMEPVEMPRYEGDAEELATLRAEGRGIVLVPKVFLQEPGGMMFLGKLFPAMGISPNNTTQYTHEDYGVCVDTEMVVDAPNRELNNRLGETTVTDANNSYTETRRPLSLPFYIAGSQMRKLTLRSYFDQDNTISIVDGSNLSHGAHDRDHRSRSLEARFEASGKLIVKTISPNIPTAAKDKSRRGFRTAGIPAVALR